MVHDFWHNFTHNVFKPLLLFFYMGFLIPIFRVEFEFPKVLYQSLTIYLLIAIGWQGGEELAGLSSVELSHAMGFLVLGFFTNSIIGILAYLILRSFTQLRQVDAATVAGYYGSDSAGTFVTCIGVLLTANLAFAAYMPVMLAVMEIPGCLVAFILVSRLRRLGLNKAGYLPSEPGYVPDEIEIQEVITFGTGWASQSTGGNKYGGVATALVERKVAGKQPGHQAHHSHHVHHSHLEHREDGLTTGYYKNGRVQKADAPRGFFDLKVLHEVFLNPGLYLLFGGIVIGFLSRRQGVEVTKANDPMFVNLFQGVLCLFLLDMGMTACQRINDLKSAGWRFVVFGLVAPNLFATIGIVVAHAFSLSTGQALEIGTYTLFAVLCGAASYIAVPAVQRMAIPEASPTLPLAASLGLTFTYNVTIGIPLYIEIAKGITSLLPLPA